jgi:hypothetical protein
MGVMQEELWKAMSVKEASAKEAQQVPQHTQVSRYIQTPCCARTFFGRLDWHGMFICSPPAFTHALSSPPRPQAMKRNKKARKKQKEKEKKAQAKQEKAPASSSHGGASQRHSANASSGEEVRAPAYASLSFLLTYRTSTMQPPPSL